MALEAQSELVAHLREGLAKTNAELGERLDEVETAKRLAGAEADVALANMQAINRDLRAQQLSHRLELLRRGDALGSARLKLSELEHAFDRTAKMLQARVSVLSSALDDAYAGEKDHKTAREKAESAMKKAKKKVKDLEDLSKKEKKKAAMEKKKKGSAQALENQVAKLKEQLKASKAAEKKHLGVIQTLKKNKKKKQGTAADEEEGGGESGGIGGVPGLDLERLAEVNRRLQEKLAKSKKKSAQLKEALRGAKEFLQDKAAGDGVHAAASQKEAEHDEEEAEHDEEEDEEHDDDDEGEKGEGVGPGARAKGAAPPAPPASRTRRSLRKRKARTSSPSSAYSSEEDACAPQEQQGEATHAAEKAKSSKKKPRKARTAAAAAASARKKLAAESAKKKMDKARASKFKPQIYEDMEEVEEEAEEEAEEQQEEREEARSRHSSSSGKGLKTKKRRLGTPHGESHANSGNTVSSSRKKKNAVNSNKRAKRTNGARGVGTKGKTQGKAFSLFSTLHNDGQLVIPQVKGSDENAQNTSRMRV
jgi:hypothetical protein